MRQATSEFGTKRHHADEIGPGGGGFLPSSVIALTTHALAFEDLVALDVPCDLGIITGNCGLVFTAALLCLHLLFTNIDPLNRRPESGEF